MITFKDIEVKDRSRAEKPLRLSDFRGCEYSFGNNYMWSRVYDIKIAFYNDFYLIKNKYGLLFPAGNGDIKEVIGVLRHYCAENNQPLFFTSMNRASMELLQSLYPGQIEVNTNRDYYDYIYEAQSLSSLAGKKLHAKRNHLNRFYENDWSYEPITSGNIEEVADMHNRWCDARDIYSDREQLCEAGALIRGLESFFELGFTGGVIRVNGEIHAYTFGEPVNSDTFVVHAEKAFTTVQGTYAAINNEFVKGLTGFTFINREEDMGQENLRKAKMSYQPAFMEEKFRVKFL